MRYYQVLLKKYLLKKGYRQSPINIETGLLKYCEVLDLQIFLNKTYNDLRFEFNPATYKVNLLKFLLILSKRLNIFNKMGQALL